MTGRRPLPLGWTAVLVVGLVAELGAWRLTRSPAFVSHVVIDNPAAFDVEVEVAGRDDGSWLPLGVAADGQKTRFSQVLDQGEEWRFRFRSAGADQGRLSLSRQALAGAAWTVPVPSANPGRVRP